MNKTMNKKLFYIGIFYVYINISLVESWISTCSQGFEISHTMPCMHGIMGQTTK
jgi:hypothetical protein